MQNRVPDFGPIPSHRFTPPLAMTAPGSLWWVRELMASHVCSTPRPVDPRSSTFPTVVLPWTTSSSARVIQPPSRLAALGLDGTIQIWRDGAAWSELPHLFTGLFQPFIDATPDGRYYVVGGNRYVPGWPDCDELAPVVHVIAVATNRLLATHETYCTLGSRHQAAI